MSRESALSFANKLLDEKKSLESVISFLRDDGFSKTQSIVMINEITGLSLKEATFLVHSSNVWIDVFQSDSEFLDSFYDFLESDDAHS